MSQACHQLIIDFEMKHMDEINKWLGTRAIHNYDSITPIKIRAKLHNINEQRPEIRTPSEYIVTYHTRLDANTINVVASRVIISCL